MTLADLSGPAAYAFILVASAVEGEVVYVSASVLVGMGRLEAVPVFLSGALGAAAGDQFYYYAARGWLGRRFTGVGRPGTRGEALLRKVRAHGAWMAAACRFLPGVRIAIGVACAVGGVPALRFSAANLAGAFLWAAGVLGFVAWGGPSWLGRLGLPGWVAWVAPAAIVLVMIAVVARRKT